MSAKFNGHYITMSDLMSDSKKSKKSKFQKFPPKFKNAAEDPTLKDEHAGSIEKQMCPWIPETKDVSMDP